LRIAQEKSADAVAARQPTVSFTMDEGKRRLDGFIQQQFFFQNPSIDQEGEQRDLTLTLTQPLYRGGSPAAGIRMAQATEAGERARTQALEQKTLQTAATAFFDVLRDEAIATLRIADEDHAREESRGVGEQLRLGKLRRTGG
jgi:outer membrane protein TolC